MAYKQLEEEVDKDLLASAMAMLSRRERSIVELRFGLKDGVEKTQKEVADFGNLPVLHLPFGEADHQKLQKEIRKMG